MDSKLDQNRRRAAARTVLAVSTCVLAQWASVAAAEIPPDQPGAFKVGYSEVTFIDAARGNRELPSDLWYPADAAAWAALNDHSLYTLIEGLLFLTSEAAKDDLPLPAGEVYPLIVFSHGFGGVNIQSVGLMEHLASHGFVVVAPEHTGNTQADNSSPDPEADRYPDVKFLIDEMAAENANSASPFFGHVDANNTGVAGHSFGGMTAMFMAAGHDGASADLRVRAIMPVAASSAALSDAELESITIPTLLMVGTLDSLQAETIRSFGLISSAPDLFRVDVVGSNHTHFANVCDIGQALLDAGIPIELWPSIGAGALVPIWEATCVPPAFPIAEATRIQNLYAAAHFRRHLLGDSDYDSYLTTEFAAANEPDVVFFVGVLPIPALGALGVLGAATVLGLAAAWRAMRSLK